MKKFFLLSLVYLALVTNLQAQRVCSTSEHMMQLEREHPEISGNREAIESHTHRFVSEYASTGSRAVINIPVVVHVVYRTSAENVSDAQINSQIQILNDDFRKLNADRTLVPAAFAGLHSDCEINFCLAQRTPTGAATNGIVRKSTTVTSFSDNDAVKRSSSGGDDAWNSAQYLNLWVCNLGGSLLGYAQFPGGPAATDGVVVNYTAFGNTGTATAPFNKGRTATHEVGHWLNLRHIWGDASCGNDQVGDTPTQQTSNYGCPSFPKVTCSNGPNGDMWMNYMDYTDDACMYMFTAGQKARMQALFAAGGSRASLATSNGCVPPSTTSCGTPTSVTTSAITSSSATVSWAAVTGATSYNVEYKLSSATTWTSRTSTTTSLGLTGLTAASVYNVRVSAVCGSTTGTVSSTVNFTTSAAASCGTPTSVTTSAITSSSATVSWATVTGATSYNVEYKLSSATTWTSRTSTTTSFGLTGLTAASAYNVRVSAVCGSTTGTVSSTVNFTTLSASGCGTDVWEANESRTASKTIATNTNINGLVCPATDVDWFKFTTTTAARNFKIDLTTLPADYDVQLYNSSGSLLLTSQNGGTTSESIIYNGGAAGTYHVRVYGYGGATSATSAYTLRVTTSGSTLRREIQNSNVENEEQEVAATENVWKVYPNPANDELHLDISSDMNTDGNIYLMNMNGQMVQSMEVAFLEGLNTFQLNVSMMPTGIYMVKVVSGKNILNQKIQISR